MFGKRNVTIVGTLILAAFILTGCLSALGTEPDGHAARVTVEIEVNSPDVLAKISSVTLKRIKVTMISNHKDTLRDVITSQGSLLSKDPETFLGSSLTSAQVVSARYDLSPNRKWTIIATLVDSQDSVRQVDTLRVSKLKAFEYRTVSMCLHPRFATYNAHFFLPSEIQLPGFGGVSKRVYFTRLNLMEGNDAKCDTTSIGASGPGFLKADANSLHGSQGMSFFQTGTFGETPSIMLADEYVKVGVRNFTLNAYGYLEGDTVGVTPMRLLFQGAQSVNTALAKESGTVTMEWQASDVIVGVDTAAVTPMLVTLGRIGTIIINVRISGEIDFN